MRSKQLHFRGNGVATFLKWKWESGHLLIEVGNFRGNTSVVLAKEFEERKQTSMSEELKSLDRPP